MMGAIHQMDRELRAERASAGRASTKARGKTGGRPRTDVGKLEYAHCLKLKGYRSSLKITFSFRRICFWILNGLSVFICINSFSFVICAVSG